MNVDLTQAAQELVSIRQKIEEKERNDVSFKKTNDLNLPVILLMNDGTQYEHKGKLSFIDVGVDANTATMTLRAEFPNPDYMLMPGLFVRAKVQVGVEENALLVPQRSILRDTKGKPYVFVAEKEKVEVEVAKIPNAYKPKTIGKPAPEAVVAAPVRAKAVRRFVELGPIYGANWLVLSGLESGEEVIAEGLQNITEGSSIAIIKTTDVEVPADADYLLKNANIDLVEEAKLDKVVEEELRENN